jgi:DNA polymerase elongation subunit (family B)
MKLAITTAESSIVEKQGQRIPCVVLIGRGEKGEYLKYRIPFYPYLYLLEEDWMKLEQVNLSKYIKEALGTKLRSLNKRILTKLVLYDGKQISELLHLLRKCFKGDIPQGESIFTLEADLSRPDLLGLRYLIDNNIKTGVSIEDNIITPIDFEYPLRCWLIDFEAYSTKVASRGPKQEEPIIIGTFYDTYTKELYTLYVKNSKWKKQPLFKTAFDKHIILGFDTEFLLLEKLTNLVSTINPDLITAWNLDRYDIVKWIQRIDAHKELGLDAADLSPLKSLARKTI